MGITKDAMVKVGTYLNRQGETKNQYKRVGRLVIKDNGEASLKIEMLPAGEAAMNWDGWVNFWDTEEEKQNQRNRGMDTVKEALKETELPPSDDIPF